MEKEKRQRIPTLNEYLQGFNTPHYFDDPRTPEEMKRDWYKRLEDSYYNKYGQEKIESTRYIKDS